MLYMKCTKINAKIQSSLEQVLNGYPLVHEIVRSIDRAGGQAYLVGGAVRDLVLGQQVKDLDIEIHGLMLTEIEQLLGAFGTVNNVGKSFGVLRVGSLDVDWSLPRYDSKGRKPEVIIDPMMDITQALMRRDLTMNAMALNLISYELIDPFNGLEHIKNKVLATPDEKFFVEDPLRFYRVMQFIGRFEMEPDANLNNICASMSLDGVSRERISDEFEKLLLKSAAPSRGFRWLNHINRLKEIVPELAALRGIPQDPAWHPEGDVFEHTMQTLDAAASLEYADNREKYIVMLSALCHDLGKTRTTTFSQDHYKSIGHAEESAAIAFLLLNRISIKKELFATVEKLIKYHMHTLFFIADNAGPAAYKRLAKKLAPDVTIYMLGLLARADSRGRNPVKGVPLPPNGDADINLFLDRAAKALVLQKAEEPILQGRDLLDMFKPGPLLGILTKRAYEIQIDEGIKDKETLKKLVIEEYAKSHT